MRRDFTNLNNDGSGRRAITAGVLPLVGLVALSAGVIAPATGATGSGIDRDKVQRSVATAFAHLYRLQTKQLNRPGVTESELNATATCNRGGGKVAPVGPGNDWRCVVSWHLPDVAATGTAIYQLDVTANGRYVADGDGPKDVNGYYLVRTPTGDGPNPLWQFDGNVELLRSTPKG
jgi:ABC-2 type transport system permease protein